MAPNNEQHYETHRYAGDTAADVRRTMNRMPDEDRSTTQQIQQSINTTQAAELTPEVRMGDDRVIGDTPNWASYSSEQLYNFATQNNSPSTADDLGRAFNDGGNNLAEAANGLLDAVTRLDGAWTGVAADSAKTALSPLAQAAGLAGQTAQLMGVRMSQQSVAASEVRKLPPPQEFDQGQSLNAMLTGGLPAMQADLKAQKDAADSVKREQISYLTSYTASMALVDAQTPSFVPPKETIGGTSGTNSSFTSDRVYIPDTGGEVRGTTTGAPTSHYTGVAGPNGAPDPAFGHGDNDQTDQSGYTPLPSPGTGASNFNPTPTTPAPSTFGPGGGTPVGGTGVPGAGAGGFGAGFGSFGSQGGGTAGGPGGNPGAGGPRGMSPTGMGPAGGPGATGGRGGPGGVGGAPRGKGDREEDKDHERPSYLVEGDPESTFGNDAMTAPPVIGGDD